MSSGGMFNYTCMANNTAGTANSTSSVSITVNGIYMKSYTKYLY